MHRLINYDYGQRKMEAMIRIHEHHDALLRAEQDKAMKAAAEMRRAAEVLPAYEHPDFHAAAEHVAKLEEIWQGHLEQEKKIRNVYRYRVLQVLKVKKQVAIRVKAMPKIKAALRDGHAFLRDITAAPASGQGFEVKGKTLRGRSRAYHLSGPKGTGTSTIALSGTDNVGTSVHEFGHALEEHVPGVHQAAMEFLAHRTAGEQPASMDGMFPKHGYKSHEKGRKDKFDRLFDEPKDLHKAYYVGKDYGSRASEVVSMGVEALYNDPVAFAKKDPEYCRFILGVLDGHLRQ